MTDNGGQHDELGPGGRERYGDGSKGWFTPRDERAEAQARYVDPIQEQPAPPDSAERRFARPGFTTTGQHTSMAGMDIEQGPYGPPTGPVDPYGPPPGGTDPADSSGPVNVPGPPGTGGYGGPTRPGMAEPYPAALMPEPTRTVANDGPASDPAGAEPHPWPDAGHGPHLNGNGHTPRPWSGDLSAPWPGTDTTADPGAPTVGGYSSAPSWEPRPTPTEPWAPAGDTPATDAWQSSGHATDTADTAGDTASPAAGPAGWRGDAPRGGPWDTGGGAGTDLWDRGPAQDPGHSAAPGEDGGGWNASALPGVASAGWNDETSPAASAEPHPDVNAPIWTGTEPSAVPGGAYPAVGADPARAPRSGVPVAPVSPATGGPDNLGSGSGNTWAFVRDETVPTPEPHPRPRDGSPDHTTQMMRRDLYGVVPHAGREPAEDDPRTDAPEDPWRSPDADPLTAGTGHHQAAPPAADSMGMDDRPYGPVSDPATPAAPGQSAALWSFDNPAPPAPAPMVPPSGPVPAPPSGEPESGGWEPRAYNGDDGYEGDDAGGAGRENAWPATTTRENAAEASPLDRWHDELSPSPQPTQRPPMPDEHGGYGGHHDGWPGGAPSDRSGPYGSPDRYDPAGLAGPPGTGPHPVVSDIGSPDGPPEARAALPAPDTSDARYPMPGEAAPFPPGEPWPAEPGVDPAGGAQYAVERYQQPTRYDDPTEHGYRPDPDPEEHGPAPEGYEDDLDGYGDERYAPEGYEDAPAGRDTEEWSDEELAEHTSTSTALVPVARRDRRDPITDEFPGFDDRPPGDESDRMYPGYDVVDYLPETEGLARITLLLGVVAVLLAPLGAVAGGLALFLGPKARRAISESQGELEGANLVTIGTWLGIAGIVLNFLVVVGAVVVFVL